MGKILSQTSKGSIEAPECPNCLSDDVTGITRVVGYYSRINNWNRSKVGEQTDRQRGEYEFGDEGLDLDRSYGGDGVEIHIYGKTGCILCSAEKRRINHLLEKNNLKGLVGIVTHEVADASGRLDAENLSLLVGIGGSSKQIPYVAVTNNGKLVHSAGTQYGINKPTTLPRQAEILDAVRYGLENQQALVS